MVRYCAALMLLMCSCSVWAQTILSLYQRVAEDYHMPASVLYSLALGESKVRLKSGIVRPWPWTLNVQGKPYFFMPTLMKRAKRYFRTPLRSGLYSSFKSIGERVMKRLFTLLLPIALSALVSPVYAKDPLVQMLPVRTPGMSPGLVARKAITQSVGQPLFIVGDDARSHRWLRAKRDYLTRIHAVGVVVNVNDARG